jgi:hypothetical protein
MSEETKPFTVKDRRHFAADGQVRDEAAPEAGGTAVTSSAAPEAPDQADPTVPPTLTGFLAGLAAQASMLLAGVVAGGGDEPAGPDLVGARHVISILEMLEEKTRGNRSSEEDRAVGALLYELRMAYLDVSRRGTS